MPTLSVLMAVHNCSPYVEEAIKSILSQSYANFELLVVDDASNDSTWLKLQRLRANDRRIRLWRNINNKGIANSLNLLLAESQGEFIARMDGDDISVPRRFEWQMDVLLANDDIDLCGGWVTEFWPVREHILEFPMTHREIKLALLFENVISHPAVMMRRRLLANERYRPEAVPAEDYDLWVRLINKGRFYNLQKVILRKRMHAQQISVRESIAQRQIASEIAAQALANFGIPATPEEAYAHGHIRDPAAPETMAELRTTEDWLCRLHSALSSEPGATEAISTNWYRYCLKATRFGPETYVVFKTSRLSQLCGDRGRQQLIIRSLSHLRIRYGSLFYRLLFSLSKRRKTVRARRRCLRPKG